MPADPLDTLDTADTTIQTGSKSKPSYANARKTI